MATWTGRARSNYFKVKDREAFNAEIARFEGVAIIDGSYDNTGRVCLIAEDTPEGGWPPADPPPGVRADCEDGDDYEPECLPDVLAAHLADNEVAILMEIGGEALRYIGGTSIAIHSSGETLRVDLGDIYPAVKRRFMVRPTLVEY
jgi:hypothetical protein